MASCCEESGTRTSGTFGVHVEAESDDRSDGCTCRNLTGTPCDRGPNVIVSEETSDSAVGGLETLAARSAVCPKLSAAAGRIRTEGALYNEIVRRRTVLITRVGPRERRGCWLLPGHEMRRRGSDAKEGDDLKNEHCLCLEPGAPN